MLIAVLDNIRSLHNVGSIFRTADGAGFEEVYLCGITPTPLDRFGKKRVPLTKVSLGAEDSLLWHYCEKTADAITQLKERGFMIIALEQSTDAVSLDALTPLKENNALIIGNEVEGIAPELLKQADIVVELPMRGHKESLNVSVAFGIAAYALVEKLNQ